MAAVDPAGPAPTTTAVLPVYRGIVLGGAEGLALQKKHR